MLKLCCFCVLLDMLIVFVEVLVVELVFDVVLISWHGDIL